jgi:hypothetical protein
MGPKQMKHIADDSLLYRPVNTTDDGKRLQEDLTELTKWAEQWQMTFHPAKCYIPHQHRLSDVVELAMKKLIYVCCLLFHNAPSC